MAREPGPVTARRRQRILDLLADRPHSAAELIRSLPGPVADSTVFKDLRWLRTRFPGQLVCERGGDARTRSWRCQGLPPTPLPEPIAHLTADELTALIAARGLLRAPEARTPGWEKPSTPYAGDLSAALHGLLDRAGLQDEAQAIAPRTIGTSRFAVAAEPAGAVGDLERALRTGRSVRLRYRNRAGVERDLHLHPLRLVLIRGEWHLFAWAPAASDAPATGGPGPTGPRPLPGAASTPAPAGRVKQYRLSRLQLLAGQTITLTDRHPSGLPILRPHDDVDRMLASGFNATSSADLKECLRIDLAISPVAWPDVVGRTWGEHQREEPAPEHGTGWRRLSFRTSGWQEARQWILSLGAEARAEGPPKLVAWLLDQATRLVSDLTPVAARQVGGIGDRIAEEPGSRPIRPSATDPAMDA